MRSFISITCLAMASNLQELMLGHGQYWGQKVGSRFIVFVAIWFPEGI